MSNLAIRAGSVRPGAHITAMLKSRVMAARLSASHDASLESPHKASILASLPPVSRSGTRAAKQSVARQPVARRQSKDDALYARVIQNAPAPANTSAASAAPMGDALYAKVMGR